MPSARGAFLAFGIILVCTSSTIAKLRERTSWDGQNLWQIYGNGESCGLYSRAAVKFSQKQKSKRSLCLQLLAFELDKVEPTVGIEPTTYSLRVNCSTD